MKPFQHLGVLKQKLRDALHFYLFTFAVPQLGRLHQYAPRPSRLTTRYRECPYPQNLPSLSIVTPSLNQGTFLERTLTSVLDQKYPSLEYILQDGGSRDDSIKIINRFARQLHHWETSPDNGQAHALNRGFAHASGEIMAYLNADDLLLPGSLAYVADYFSRHPEVDVVYGHRLLIDETDQEIGQWILPPHSDQALLWKDFVPQETLFWRRRIWEKVGGFFDESYRFALDWELLLRFHKAGARFVRLPRFLGAFRIHIRQKTSAHFHDLGIVEIENLRQCYHGRPLSQAQIDGGVRSYLFRHLLHAGLFRLGLVRY